MSSSACGGGTGVSEDASLPDGGGVDASDASSVVDAGDASSVVDAGDAGDAAPMCTGPSECAQDPSEPICDTGSGQCRGCQSSPECAASYPSRPLCETGSTACVACLDSAAHCTTDPDAPICDHTSWSCRGCQTSAECLAADPSHPVCHPTNHRCVACADSAADCATEPTAPICDDTSWSCRQCQSHAECAAPLGIGVCDPSGACLASADVIWVDAAASCPGMGTEMAPLCTLQAGIDAAAGGNTTPDVVVVRSGTYGVITVADQSLWVIALEPGVIIDALTTDPLVSISGATSLTLEGITVGGSSANSLGVVCMSSSTPGPEVTFRSCTVTQNNQGGISAFNCDVSIYGSDISNNADTGISLSGGSTTIQDTSVTGNNATGISLSGGSTGLVERCQIIDNNGGGLDINNSDYTVHNCIIGENGSNTSVFGGVRLGIPPSVGEFVYNTVAHNYARTGVLAGIQCFPVVGSLPVGSCLVTNNQNGDLDARCTPDAYTRVTGDGQPAYANPGGFDFHITAPGSMCIDQGDPNAYPPDDVDGTARYLGAGPDCGAHEAG